MHFVFITNKWKSDTRAEEKEGKTNYKISNNFGLDCFRHNQRQEFRMMNMTKEKKEKKEW